MSALAAMSALTFSIIIYLWDNNFYSYVIHCSPVLYNNTAPFRDGPSLDVYNIGSTICLQIDPFDPSRNDPSSLARLRCADVLQDNSRNIPTPLPAPVFSWTHISLDGRQADFAINVNPDDLDDSMYMPPQEFLDTFPLIGDEGTFAVSTEAEESASSLDFSTNNITKNFSDPKYLALREAFGFWICTLNNSLGMETATSFISDMCKQP